MTWGGLRLLLSYGTTEVVAQAYSEIPLYAGGTAGDRGQELLPASRSQSPGGTCSAVSPKIKLFTIDDTFGGWQKAQKMHFSEGGTFDQNLSEVDHCPPTRPLSPFLGTWVGAFF